MQEQILDALRRGAHDEALSAAQAAVEADPQDARGHHMLALALQAAGDRDAAMRSIDRALESFPDDAGLHFQRAGLLLHGRDLEQARKVLDDTIRLDPNQFGAYVMQAELALGRGDHDEAERLVRTAERLVPEHPVLLSIQAMVALQRDDKAGALALASAASGRAPDDPQVLNALGFVYRANEHYAFAEQAFRRLRERSGAGNPALTGMIVDMLVRQQRLPEALEELEALLQGPEAATPVNLRAAGELALRIGDPARALRWLRSALAAMPDDPRTLELAMECWGRQRDRDAARNTLEAALSTSPGIAQLWRARLATEQDAAAAEALIERWLAALPDSVDAHEARTMRQLATGDEDAAEASLRHILELAPGHMPAEGRLLDLLARRDPREALEYVRGLQARTGGGDDPGRRHGLRIWLGLALHGTGEHAEAAEVWAALRAEAAGIAPPAPTPADAVRKPRAQAAEDAPRLAFLSGLPGSGVEHVARLLDGVVPAFRADRFGPNPPGDPLQNINTIPELAGQRSDGAEVVAQWRQALAGRGLSAQGAVIDWLLWWDNALLDAIAPQLPHAQLLIALRDPRDMLLDWLAFGAPVPLRLASPEDGAAWLAGMLEHVAVLQERALHPHTLLRLDDTVSAPRALAAQLGQALGLELPEPSEDLFGRRRFEPGGWRAYAGTTLAGAFATLTPVAVRLGYPES